MAEIKVYYDNGWSYSGDNRLNYIGTFKNPSSSERAEIHSLTVNIGTIKGECSWAQAIGAMGIGAVLSCDWAIVCGVTKK